MTDRPQASRLRLTFIGGVAASLLSVLVLRLWFLQVLTHEQYAEAAENNQVRIVPVEPGRGRILDRSGAILVRNRPSLTVSIRPDQMIDRNATLKRLSPLLGMTVEQIEERLQDRRALPYTPIPIKEDVPEDVVVYIREHAEEFRGTVAETRPVRVYPNGTVASHLVGYTGEITAQQLEDPRYDGYRQGSIVGRSGIEFAYERDLRGEEGKVKLLVGASGKSRGELPGSRRQPAEPGHDVKSTIDIRIQTLTEESLVRGIEKARTIFDKESQKHYLAPAGGVVVMNPQNGEVLAMASHPSYDPSAFVGGISTQEFKFLSDDPANPLLNRPIQAAFPPGSTFKVVTAAAALQDGLASRGGSYDCPASYRFSDRTFRNWRSSDSGAISLQQAIVDSCDTVFYAFGAEFWRKFRRGEGERLQDHARAFGLGSPTGVDLPFEAAGRIPDEAWLKEMNARFPQAFPYKVWLPGYTINMSIGQGDVLTTPLQLANVYSAIANGGTVYVPRVGLQIVDGNTPVRDIEPVVAGKLNVSPANLEVIRRGLEGVPTHGTARGAFSGFPFGVASVAGKTGTAELQTKPPKQPYAWFVAYAPAREPRYLVAVMLEEGGHGGETAAPVARRILEGILGLPTSEIQPAQRTD